ncbi:hypothetical protein BH10BAC4_BH10BAC4_14220 [soil metagenome]
MSNSWFDYLKIGKSLRGIKLGYLVLNVLFTNKPRYEPEKR